VTVFLGFVFVWSGACCVSPIWKSISRRSPS